MGYAPGRWLRMKAALAGSKAVGHKRLPDETLGMTAGPRVGTRPPFRGYRRPETTTTGQAAWCVT